jgi:hypothetical protein
VSLSPILFKKDLIECTISVSELPLSVGFWIAMFKLAAELTSIVFLNEFHVGKCF